MADVYIEQAELLGLASRFDATVGQVEEARLSALRKMRQRVETALKRRAAKELVMPQKAIAGRFYSNTIKPGEEKLRVWIGTHPVSPHALSSVSAYGVRGKTGGVKAGKRTYPGAFLARIYSGTEKVWIRLHSTHYSPELYPTKYRSGDRGWGELRGRFPVVRAVVPVDAVLERIVAEEGPSILAAFEQVFTQELNYYTNIRGQH